MDSVHRLVTTLGHASQFLSNVEHDQEMREAQVQSLRMQIQTLHLDFESAAVLTDGIKAGDWKAAEKKTLMAAAASRLSTEAQTQMVSKRNQMCFWFERYLCSKDWEVLRSDASIETKCAQMCKRSADIKLFLPDPKTIGKMSSVLINAGVGGSMDCKAAHGFFASFSETIKKFLSGKHKGSALLWEYPMDPQAVPSFIPFSEGEEPSREWESFPAIATIFNNLPLRSHNAKLREPKQDTSTDAGSLESIVKDVMLREASRFMQNKASLPLQLFTPGAQQPLALTDSVWQHENKWWESSGADEWKNQWSSNADRQWKGDADWQWKGSTWKDPVGCPALGSNEVKAWEHAALGGEPAGHAITPKTKKAVLKRPAGAKRRPAAAPEKVTRRGATTN